MSQIDEICREQNKYGDSQQQRIKLTVINTNASFSWAVLCSFAGLKSDTEAKKCLKTLSKPRLNVGSS